MHRKKASSPEKIADFNALTESKAQEAMAHNSRFTSEQKDTQKKFLEAVGHLSAYKDASKKTLSEILQAERSEEAKSTAKLRSERFKITVDKPPYGGIDRDSEIGILSGTQPLLS